MLDDMNRGDSKALSLCSALVAASLAVLAGGCAAGLRTSADRIAAFPGGTTETALARAYLTFLEDPDADPGPLEAAEQFWLEIHPWDTPESLVDARRDLRYVQTLIETGLDEEPRTNHPTVELLQARLHVLDARAGERHAERATKRIAAAVQAEPTGFDEAFGYWQAHAQSSDEQVRELAKVRLQRLGAERSDEEVHRASNDHAVPAFRDVASRARLSVVSIVVHDAAGLDLGQGSGVVVGDGNTVVTNFHVVEHASGATVSTMSGKELSVQAILATAPDVDLAVLYVPDLGLPPIVVSEEGDLQVGDPVIALGSPKGLTGTVSQGIVSAIRRLPQFGSRVIQTTAPISEGSSGGALVSEAGMLVGVTTLIMDSGQNLNFAVPADEVAGVLRVAHSKSGKPHLPWPGQSLAKLPPDRIFEAAHKMLQVGEVDAASTLCERGLEGNPDDVGLLVCAVVTRATRCDRDGALGALSRLRRLDQKAWAAGMAMVQDADRDGKWTRCDE
jgi:S1-C subfamily serine protease